MKNNEIKNVFELMDCIRTYEPYLIRYIMDFVFIPCYEKDWQNYDYIRALPEKKSTLSLKSWSDSLRLDISCSKLIILNLYSVLS